MLPYLFSKTNAELVEIYNSLNPTKPLKQWKQSKKALIERIETLWIFEDDKLEQIDVSDMTIRDASLELLSAVDFYEDKKLSSSDDNRVSKDHPNARSVGFSYDAVLTQIQKAFPEARTSVACLRWYSVKVRGLESGFEDYTLPQRRPRASMKRKS